MTTVAQEKQVLVTSIERRVIDAHAVHQCCVFLVNAHLMHILMTTST